VENLFGSEKLCAPVRRTEPMSSRPEPSRLGRERRSNLADRNSPLLQPDACLVSFQSEFDRLLPLCSARSEKEFPCFTTIPRFAA
jgi:hypothetical protein